MDYTEWQAVDCDFVVRIDNFIITQLTAYRQKQANSLNLWGYLLDLFGKMLFGSKQLLPPHHLINSVVFLYTYTKIS